MVANGRAFGLGWATGRRPDRNQRKIGGAAADVADEHAVARLKVALPVGVVGKPRVKRGLRLFEQRGMQAHAFGRFERELARHFVKRCRNAQNDLFAGEVAAGAEAPGGGQVREIGGGSLDWRQPPLGRALLAVAPRQDWAQAVDAWVAQPRLSRRDQASRDQRALGAREFTHGLVRVGGGVLPRQA